jgi:hypothetical protein
MMMAATIVRYHVTKMRFIESESFFNIVRRYDNSIASCGLSTCGEFFHFVRTEKVMRKVTKLF